MKLDHCRTSEILCEITCFSFLRNNQTYYFVFQAAVCKPSSKLPVSQLLILTEQLTASFSKSSISEHRAGVGGFSEAQFWGRFYIWST